jgi:hypothetical protein
MHRFSMEGFCGDSGTGIFGRRVRPGVTVPKQSSRAEHARAIAKYPAVRSAGPDLDHRVAIE